ncbi:hypothetical protein GQ457_05G019360 [Hibiscus cannabinus]
MDVMQATDGGRDSVGASPDGGPKNPSCRPTLIPPWDLRRFPYPGTRGRVFVEIKDPNKSFQKEIKIVIFLRFMLGAFSPVNRKRRSSFRCLTI